MYIVFEGIIGTGKTTQSKLAFEYLKKKYPKRKVIWTREPGGSEIADSIRKVVQGTKFAEEMDPLCEAYLYASSRAQTLHRIVKPVIEKGGIVVSDRNYLTSLTNQAFGRKIGYDKVYEINRVSIEGFLPDWVMYLDIKIETALKRVFDGDGDKFESLGKSFYKRVCDGYRFVSTLPQYKNKWIVIDANTSPKEIFKKIKIELDKIV